MIIEFGISNLPLYQFSQRSEGDRFFSATLCDEEIFASCHCDKCELVKVIVIRLLLIFDYQLVLPFDFLTFNKIFVVDYATMPLNVDIQRVYCRTFNNIVRHDSTLNVRQ